MASTDASQWRIFNVLRRLLGIGATFAGTVAAISFGLGLPSTDGELPARNWPSLLTGTLVALIGLSFLLMPPFRPDLGDTRVFANPLRDWAKPRVRRWWTGDLLP
ncbi:MAG TPA: hypothetical protein VEI47_04090 [Gemmatimonadales bacterium]|jgi:hypothetical protein|nr:hypothetical protein [Gemmatimonadales bacterium]